MKAMILAAGFGTRLRPYTLHTPKPLFTVAGRPLLAETLKKLADAGCDAAVVNTHHLAERIEAFLSENPPRIPVRVSREKEILGTGGAVRHVADFWDERPFLLINGDIVFDFDLSDIYRRHLETPALATMVLVKHPGLDSVAVTPSGHVAAFVRTGTPPGAGSGGGLYTFTGIHVIEPALLDYIPARGCSSIIDAYETAMAEGHRINAHIVRDGRWSDIGTPRRYRRTACEAAAPLAFEAAAGFRPAPGEIGRERIQGDGSDRQWFRLRAKNSSIIMADHGIHARSGQGEAAAFTDIGRHLHAAGVRVPEIFWSDPSSGLVFMEDLGGTRLQSAVLAAGSEREVAGIYRRVIDALLHMATAGSRGFDTGWTCQTPEYDRSVILENECRYFVEAFLNGYLERRVEYSTLAGEFEVLAENTLRHAHYGLMHRDMQSRNILLYRGEPCFIDFQGARIGPVQYDLASLLIDPYVHLSRNVRESLFDYACRRLAALSPLDRGDFQKGYECCCLTRNLQILGAFGFLTRVKRKPLFEQYIPAAVESLKRQRSVFDMMRLAGLKKIVAAL